MKKIILISIVVCLSIILTSSMALAQSADDVVVINPIRWDPAKTVYSDQTIIFDLGWAACNRGLVQNFLNANYLAFILDGSPVVSSEEVNQYWGPIQQIPAPPAAEACVGKTPEKLWRAKWDYQYGTLEAGDHTLRFILKVDHPVLDGGDYDGNGAPDLFNGTLHDFELIIHVEDPL